MSKEKEFLYVGHYIDVDGNYILKIGTTSNLKRRKSEHEYYYKRTKNYPMPENGKFIYDWKLKLAHDNTLKFEELNKQEWTKIGVGQYIKKDRYLCSEKLESVIIKIKREYKIEL